jgi:glycerol kinase
VTRSIDNIDFATLPETRHGSRGNRNTSLFFLCHPIGGRTIAVATHFTNFVVDARAVQNTFGCGCFTRINVSDNTDITIVLKWDVLLCHSCSSFLLEISYVNIFCHKK